MKRLPEVLNGGWIPLLQERCSIIQFSVAEGGGGGGTPVVQVDGSIPESSGARPRPILECVVKFLAGAVEWAFSGACWRACRNIHALLHAAQFAAEGEAAMAWLVPRFCEAASHRLQRCTSMNVPLAKPLLLVIAVCFISFPAQVEHILCVDDGDDGATPVHSLLIFAEALASLAESEADPGLSLESELKIAGSPLTLLSPHAGQNRPCMADAFQYRQYQNYHFVTKCHFASIYGYAFKTAPPMLHNIHSFSILLVYTCVL